MRKFLVSDVSEYEAVKMDEKELLDTAHFIAWMLNDDSFDDEENVIPSDIESAIDILESANIFVEEIV